MISENTRVIIYAPHYPLESSEQWQDPLCRIGKYHGEKGIVIDTDLPWSYLVELDCGDKIWVWEREIKEV